MITTNGKPMDCDTCIYKNTPWDEEPCVSCGVGEIGGMVYTNNYKLDEDPIVESIKYNKQGK